MRKFIGSSLLVSAAAGGAIALSATAAFAAGWTVTNPNADGHFSVSSTHVVFTDTATGSVFTCANSTIKGSAPSGTNLGNPVATLTSGTFTNCTGPLGSTGSATLSGGSLNAASYNAGTDTVTGNITGIGANLTINSILGTCTGTVAGSIGTNNSLDTYANGTGTLDIKADPSPLLAIGTTSGNCAGLINPNDPVTFVATYTGTDPAPPNQITVRPS